MQLIKVPRTSVGIARHSGLSFRRHPKGATYSCKVVLEIRRALCAKATVDQAPDQLCAGDTLCAGCLVESRSLLVTEVNVRTAHTP